MLILIGCKLFVMVFDLSGSMIVMFLIYNEGKFEFNGKFFCYINRDYF